MNNNTPIPFFFESQHTHVTILEEISATEGKRLNITKDAPISLIAQKVPRVLASLCQKWEEYLFLIIDYNVTLCNTIEGTEQIVKNSSAL